MPPVGDNNSNNGFNNTNNNQVPPSMAPQSAPVDDGKTLSIIGLILSFFGLQLIGLILSIIGLNKAKKAGSSKGIAIAGIVLNVIGIVVGLIVWTLIIIGAFSQDSQKTTITENPSSSDSSYSDSKNEDMQPSAITATNTSDYSKMCNNNYSVSNGATYTKGSAKVAAFYNTESGSTYYSQMFDLKDSWKADSKTPSQVQLVACLTFKDGSSAGKSCDFQSSGQTVSIPLYHSNYELKVYEAKTGELVTSKDIQTNSNECPSFASYDKNDPKVYEKPTGALIEGALTPYAG